MTEESVDYKAVAGIDSNDDTAEVRGVVGFKEHPKAPASRAWDGAAARRRLKSWAGDDWGKYAQGFAWFDDDAEETLGAYKLPHHDVIGGRIHSVWTGVRAAMQSLLGARGGVDIPSSDRRAAYDHLAAEYRHHGEDPPEFRVYDNDWSDESFSPHLMCGRVKPDALPLDDATAEFLHQQGLAVDEGRLYLKRITPSTQALDSYGTRMAENSLRNYLKDIVREGGIPFMRSHRTGGFVKECELPYGRVFRGGLDGGPLSETPLLMLGDDAKEIPALEMGLQLDAELYMVRGMWPNGTAETGTDSLIDQMEALTLRKVSIGFGPDVGERPKYICGLCGLDIRSSACPHFPLVRDADTGLLAFAWVKDAHLHEVSAVWAGATPGALIHVARAKYAAGLIPFEACEHLEELYRTRIRGTMFPVKEVRVLSKPLQSKQEVGELDEVALVASADLVLTDCEAAGEVGAGGEGVQLDDSVSEEGASPEHPSAAWEDASDEMASRVEELGARCQDLSGQVADLEGLRPLAELGRAYMEELIGKAIEARVRAGVPNNLEAYRRVLGGMEIDEIKAEIEAHEAQVSRRFIPGSPSVRAQLGLVDEPQEQEPARRGGRPEDYKV